MTSTPDTAPAHTAKDGKGILITEPAMQQLAKLCGEQGENQVLRVGEPAILSQVITVETVFLPFLDPEADGAGGHAVGQQDVADDGPPHEPLALLLAGEEARHVDSEAVGPGQQRVLTSTVEFSSG